MIRGLLINPLIVAITAALGLALCKVMGIPAHAHEMVQALIIILAAAELAIVPLLIVRNSSQMAVSQAALAGMVIHLLVVAGAVALLPFNRPMTFWLAAFYGTTLISVSITNIAALRSAPLGKPQSAANGSSN